MPRENINYQFNVSKHLLEHLTRIFNIPINLTLDVKTSAAAGLPEHFDSAQMVFFNATLFWHSLRFGFSWCGVQRIKQKGSAGRTLCDVFVGEGNSICHPRFPERHPLYSMSRCGYNGIKGIHNRGVFPPHFAIPCHPAMSYWECCVYKCTAKET